MRSFEGRFAASVAMAALVAGCGVENAECIESGECLDPDAWRVPGCVPTGGVDAPDPEGLDTDCDGVDGDARRSVFVSLDGDDTWSGSRVAPVRTVEAALALAEDGGFVDVLLAKGVYAETVVLREGIGVHGGYVDEGGGYWGRHGVSVLSPAGTALRVEGIEESTRVSRVALAPVAIEPGQSAIGAHVVDSSGLVLEDVIVAPGPGRAGADGITPAAPAQAANGEDGDDARYLGTACGGMVEGPRGGAGGGAPTDCAGGEGGDGGGTPPEDLFPNASVGGLGNRYECGSASAQVGGSWGVRTPEESHAAGQDGVDGSAGGAGTAAAAATPASFDASGLHAGEGGAGSVGGRGTGGAGGGGAARQGSGDGVGGLWFCHIGGGGGGGGGQGGFGGFGGPGGGGGGSSVGLLVWSASPTLRRVRITPLPGGDGGAGAPGGPGGLGGLGGVGGDGLLPPGEELVMVYLDAMDQMVLVADPPVTDPSYGGDGGQGGAGGPGGPGGGGAGGSSVGILANASSTLELEEVLVALDSATPGAGGPGAESAPGGPAGVVGEVLWLPAEGGALPEATGSP